MLFHSSIRTELARSFGVTLVVLVTVVMTMMLIRTLGQASRGTFDPADVMLVMGYTVLGHLPSILTMSLFIAVVGTLSRMYRDSEMVIWFSSGRGLTSLLGPLFRFAWPVLLGVLVLSVLVWPWSQQRIIELRNHYETRGDLDRVQPGFFQASAAGTRVFFVEKDLSGSGEAKNVFIATQEDGKETVTSARKGRVEIRAGERFLMLEQGQRLEQELGKPELKLSEFESYAVRIGSADINLEPSTPERSRNTLALIAEPTNANLGELSWRLGLALAAINLVLMGLAIAHVNPRVGRSGNLMFALFAFVIYFNLTSIGVNWITSGRVPFGTFMLSLHGGTFACGALWLAMRHNQLSWRRLLPRRTAATAGGQP